MAAFSLYIIQSTICLTLFYAGYKALLSNETFFAFNRKVLLGGVLACLFLPFIPLKTTSTGIIQQPMIQLEKAITEMEKESLSTPEIFQANKPDTGIAKKPVWTLFSPLSICLGIFIFGGMANLYLLIRSCIQLRQIIRRGKQIVKDGYCLVILGEKITPFNYGSYIVMSDYDYRHNFDILMAHELAHLCKRHSFDLLFMEIVNLFHWFNPVVWLFKRELQDVHEYEADREVLNKGIDAIKYQLLLVRKAVGPSSYTLANSFNHRTLKKRISMMLRKKSNKWARLRLVLLVPLAAITLAAFANPGIARQLEQIIRNEDTVNPPDTNKFTLGFFESELNKYLARIQGNTSSSPNEKLIFLKSKTNRVSLFVNAKNDVALNEHIIRKADVLANLPTLLAETLLDSPKNGKPVLVYMIIDEASHAEFVDKILGIVGTTFANNREALEKRNQQPLLLLGDRKSFNGKVSDSHQVKVNLYDGTGNRLAAFEVDNQASIGEMRKQLKSISFDGKGNYAVSIIANPDTPMGMITDVKQTFRDCIGIKFNYRMSNM